MRGRQRALSFITGDLAMAPEQSVFLMTHRGRWSAADHLFPVASLAAERRGMRKKTTQDDASIDPSCAERLFF